MLQFFVLQSYKLAIIIKSISLLFTDCKKEDYFKRVSGYLAPISQIVKFCLSLFLLFINKHKLK